MWTDPLHPAVVHFPIVLAVLLPIFALGALWAIRRGVEARAAWALPLVLAAALSGSAWLALETGESQEDRVEDVVGEAPLHEHEEAAERFFVLSLLVLVVAGAGLAGGTVGTAGRLLATLGAIGVTVAGLVAGQAGGELVYRHGAASVYVMDARETGGAGAEGAEEFERESDDEEEEHR